VAHWRTHIPTDRLCAGDLQGQDLTVVIERVQPVVVDDLADKRKKKSALDVYFKGKKKPLLVKATNAKAISKLVGSPLCEKWINQAITLYPTNVSAFGEMVEAIRVRPNKPGTAATKEAETRVDPVAQDDLTEDDKRAIAAAEAAEAAARG
jgi:hypothetical protein